MDVYITSESHTCSEFQASKGKKKETISVVISPIKVQSDEKQAHLKVINGCNMWRSCYNPGCFFSLAARTGEKVETRI